MGVFPAFVPPNPAGVGTDWHCPICRRWPRGHGQAEHMRSHGEPWERGPGRPPGPAKAAAMAGPAAAAAAGAMPPNPHPTEAQLRIEAIRQRILEPGGEGGAWGGALGGARGGAGRGAGGGAEAGQPP